MPARRHNRVQCQPPAGAPLHDFAGYGQAGSIQGGWSVFIIVWHALHSVLYPILLTRWMFPAAAGRRWFAAGRARWLLYVLLVLLAGLYALYFLNPERNDPAVFVHCALAEQLLPPPCTSPNRTAFRRIGGYTTTSTR